MRHGLVAPPVSRDRHRLGDVEKGGGVYLKLENGGWGKLPDLGYNSQGLTNTIRAWLKRQRADRQT